MSEYNFDDVVPVQLNEEQPQLCQILYDDEYKLVMGKLLALQQQEEYSERALYLTEKGLELLASHYTIWSYRFNIIKKIGADLFKELDWCELIALDNEKNYQIWNYRQLIIEEILKVPELATKFDPHREYPILNMMLQQDLKNHHVWSYRKWLVERFNLFEDPKEIEFVNACIDNDLRNNSVWSHRYFIFIKTFDENNPNVSEYIDSEIEFVKNAILRSPQNPSSWNYLIGVYDKCQKRSIVELKPFIDDNMVSSDYTSVKSSYALELLAKIYLKQNDHQTAGNIYDLLSTKYDPIRSNYWAYEKRKLITSA